ncbi:MAG: NifB/NifX family molybdenum-iron cluster-binding protein [Pirellulales bacterium]|nr:NifB/NifX family molybdenum-iron cluster-binding protein [Pirellulales bacterium]
MKIAAPTWRGRISPVFDVAEQVLLVTLDGQTESDRCTESLRGLVLHERAERLAKLGVNVLLCGAISWQLETLLLNGGVKVISLICGDVEEVIQAFRNGTLKYEQFAMPGCCGRMRRGRGRGRGRGRRRGWGNNT